MPVGVCAVRSDMVVSVGMRDCMRVDVAAVEMRRVSLSWENHTFTPVSSEGRRRRFAMATKLRPRDSCPIAACRNRPARPTGLQAFF